MNLKQQILNLLTNISALDARKKTALALAIVFTLLATIGVSSYFNKPATAPLYSNLSREDLNSISRVLSESQIEFVVLPEKGSVEVPPGLTGQARLILAEHGLPSSQESGYELFDKMNTLGLTSFMQDVTNKRAIEGELVRTIEMISGVNAARVHLVMAEKNVYRRNLSGAPTASVVLKSFGTLPTKSINAIRKMVAAAVPGLESASVTIIGADGTLLTSNDEDGLGGSTRLVELEKEFERDTQNKISDAIGAHLGGENFRVSVTAKLNSDKRKIDERVYDPDSRVARSVQVVREIGTTENKESVNSTSVEQNLPAENVPAGSGQSSLENSERREELTNYEINEKSISVISDGYQIESVSVALVVNKTRIEELLGANPTAQKISDKIAELEGIAKSAISASDERGDKITVSIVEFLPSIIAAEAEKPNSLLSFVANHFGSILNSGGLIIASIIFALLGIKPLVSLLGREPSERSENNMLIESSQREVSLPDVANLPGASGEDSLQAQPNNVNGLATSEKKLADMVVRETKMKEHLENMVSENEERAAFAMRQWLREDRAKTA